MNKERMIDIIQDLEEFFRDEKSLETWFEVEFNGKSIILPKKM
jgi:hypothetical protein